MNIARRCPFCEGPIQVHDTTEPERRVAGLVYLRADCVICRIRLASAGVGLDDALRQLDHAIAKRVGTGPAQWIIEPKAEKRRGRR